MADTPNIALVKQADGSLAWGIVLNANFDKIDPWGGDFKFASDNLKDIGAVAAGRPRDLYLGGSVKGGSWLSTAIAVSRGGTGADFSAATQGSLWYFNAAGVLTTLAPGTSGKYLKTLGAGADPMWDTPAGGGGGSLPVFPCRPTGADFPATNFPQLEKVAGTNWTGYRLSYDQTTEEAAFWTYGIPTGITIATAVCEIWYDLASVVAGTATFKITTLSRAEAEDGDAAGTTDTSANDTVPGTAGQVGYVSTTLTTTGWAAGELLLIKIARDVTVGGRAAGDVRLRSALIRLT